MRISIRTRLFLAVMALSFLFVVLYNFFNRTALLPYYLYETRAKLLQDAERIDSEYSGKSDSLSNEIQVLEWNNGVHIALFNTNFQVIYMSANRDNSAPPPPPGERPGETNRNDRRRDNPPKNYLDLYDRVKTQGPGSYAFQEMVNPMLGIRFLDLGFILKNSDFIILSRPIAALETAADEANRFLILSGFIIILAGAGAAMFFSKGFTAPIRELRDIAHKMASLDFSSKFKVRTRDEIGELGESINSLSEQLDHAVTGLSEANEKLRLDIDKERKLEEMRRDFVASVSHELKTPLALIQGYAEGLQEGVADTEETRTEYCSVIRGEADKMARLVQDLLDLSQYESGVFHLKKTEFDLSELAETLVSKYETVLQDKGIQFERSISGVFKVLADRSRIEQVLTNFLNNAVDHADENKKIKVALTSSRGMLTCSVFNSGKPVPENEMDKIWLRFYKTDPARTRTYGGSGLGLAIVRAVLELHGAEYGAFNHPDGVEFFFRLKLTLS